MRKTIIALVLWGMGIVPSVYAVQMPSDERPPEPTATNFFQESVRAQALVDAKNASLQTANTTQSYSIPADKALLKAGLNFSVSYPTGQYTSNQIDISIKNNTASIFDTPSTPSSHGTYGYTINLKTGVITYQAVNQKPVKYTPGSKEYVAKLGLLIQTVQHAIHLAGTGSASGSVPTLHALERFLALRLPLR